jgi:hypothetical protein
MENITIREFYKEIFGENGGQLDYFLNSKGNTELGHFNVFDTKKFYFSGNKTSEMTYNRRMYYKISLIKGKKSGRVCRQNCTYRTTRNFICNTKNSVQIYTTK